MQSLEEFYKKSPRLAQQPFNASFPVRDDTEVKVYTLSRDYFANGKLYTVVYIYFLFFSCITICSKYFILLLFFKVAIALLRAQNEIFITSWKNSPKVLLTRPPLPPLRLDQILKYKAEQGVKIYILLYKEVELAAQGNESFAARRYLESLHANITCLRHPNKLIGGSTAVLWSHHEKLVIIDRCMSRV